MADQRLLVQFLHPGGEHKPDAPGKKGWSTGSHRRKFLASPGAYIDHRDRRHEGRLVFWGEWEPQSTCTAYQERAPGRPRWLHDPYYSFRGANKRSELQNTDPFVFGPCFFYAGCQQHKRGSPTALQRLECGSVILFGSCLQGLFVADTVFVVGCSEAHGSGSPLGNSRTALPRALRDVTLDRFTDGNCGRSRQYRLYSGATPDKAVEGMFSFFPCLPVSKAPHGFARPTIRLPGITQNLTQGFKATKFDGTSPRAVWDSVVAKVRQAGLCLGVHAAIPKQV